MSNKLPMPQNSIKRNETGTLALALVGDGVYELLVREMIVSIADMPVQKLHLKCVQHVKASAQARAYDIISPLLTEKELSVMKRGRNNSTSTAPKNADITEYRKATGIETLFGYLYLGGETERIQELFAAIMRQNETDAANMPERLEK